MKHSSKLLSVLVCALMSACASNPGSSKPAQANNAQPAKSAPEASVAAIAGSKFAQLHNGMEQDQVQELMGRAPDRQHTYETGKRWIPFYFGTDARRTEALYKSEGCLTFTAGNAWGAGGGELVNVEQDPSGACYKR